MRSNETGYTATPLTLRPAKHTPPAAAADPRLYGDRHEAHTQTLKLFTSPALRSAAVGGLPPWPRFTVCAAIHVPIPPQPLRCAGPSTRISAVLVLAA